MYAEIAAAAASIKTFSDLTTLILKTKVDSAVTAKAIESQSAIISLQDAMLNLQSQHQSLLREKEVLEKRLIDAEDWNAEASKYSLKEIAPGVFVYVLNLNGDSPTPTHWLCSRCYQEKRKSILQKTGKSGGANIYLCLLCQNTLLIYGTPGEQK